HRPKRHVRRAEHDVDARRPGEPHAEVGRLARPLEHLPVPRDEHEAGCYSGGIAATPGSSFPSSSSSEAPPPVETQETRSSRPSSVSARTESAPPTTEYAPAAATACATAFVPSAKRGHSKTPICPFQKIVLAPPIRSAKARRVCGPMSSPSQPSGSSSKAVTRASASGSNEAAATTSTGSSTSKSSGFSL